MRIFPILSAVLVAAVLYLAVMERERLVGFSRDPSLSVLLGRGVEEEPEAGSIPETVTSAVEDTLGLEDDAASGAAAAAEQEEPVRRVSVVTEEFRAQTIDDALQVSGTTQAVRAVDVRAETAALVMSEPKERGSIVEEGEVLCRLDPGTRRATLAEAQARLTEAEINYNAAYRLSQDGFATETRRASAAAALQSAEAAVEAAEREIERLTIRAPFAGILETDSAELGSYLQPGALCARVIRLDPILMVGFVPETAVDRIEVGTRAGARLAAGGQVEGEVTFVSRAADPATRTFRVEVTVENPDLKVRDGQTAEILIQTDGAQAHLVPGSALTLNDAGDLGLRLVDEDGKAAFHEVKMLRDTAEGVWVSGLPEVAEVIVVGQEYVVDGVPVDPRPREATQ